MLKNFILLFAVILFTFSAVSAQEETEPANDSAITGTQIPAGALRVLPSSYPREINEAFENLVSAAKGKVTPGKREVLAWTQNYKKSDASGLIKKIQTEWQSNGWKYEMSGRDGDLEVFGLYTEQSTRRVVLGFFAQGDDGLVLSLMEVLPLSAENAKASTIKTKADNSSIKNSAAKILDVGKNEGSVNVMGNEMPSMPTFTALKPKAGFVRGYVKDWTGKPLPNAAIGVRASYLAGMYSGAQGKTDAKGFYEFAVPKGSAHFYNAGYALEWGDGLAALGLHPADGNLDSFVTTDGAVENFVLLPYGITSRENVQNNPLLSSGYYGGSIYVGYYAREKNDNNPMAGSILEDSILEITLTPEGALLDGSPGQIIVVRNTIGFRGNFKINNIPLGRYQISAKIGGKSVNLKQSGSFDPSSPFGMKPRESNDAANILFAPNEAKANMVSPQTGGWDAVAISVAQP